LSSLRRRRQSVDQIAMSSAGGGLGSLDGGPGGVSPGGDAGGGAAGGGGAAAGLPKGWGPRPGTGSGGGGAAGAAAEALARRGSVLTKSDAPLTLLSDLRLAGQVCWAGKTSMQVRGPTRAARRG
jgi:hypothetical protein